MVKKSEFIAKIEELFGDEDVDIYFLDYEGNLSNYFNISIDSDGDALIKM